MKHLVTSSLTRLLEYCESNNYIGYDPYDGLESSLFNSIPFLSKNKFCKLAWIQLFKRSPLNLRKISGVPKLRNAKAYALFLSAYCVLYKQNPQPKYLLKINYFIKELLALQSANKHHYASWGYPFAWQSKSFYLPKNTANVVTTTFVANALLDAFEITKEDSLLNKANSSCEYILNDLHKKFDSEKNYCISYSAFDHSEVYNASMLAAALLSRVFKLNQKVELKNEAIKIMNYVCKQQQPNGSWFYGSAIHHQWIDSFHTGYNLVSLRHFIDHTGAQSFEENLNRGYQYYIHHFVTQQGCVKYYHQSQYPLDIHAVSQFILTVLDLNEIKNNELLMEKVISRSINNMQSENGFFYFREYPLFINRIPYMRWSQAWMLLALVKYCSHQKIDHENLV